MLLAAGMLRKVLVVLMIVISWGHYSFAYNVDNAEALISVNTERLSFDEVLKKIAEQTNYKIQNRCLGIKFQKGNYSHISLEQFFRRTLKNSNVALLFDEKEHVLQVTCVEKSVRKNIVSLEQFKDKNTPKVIRGELVKDNEFVSDLYAGFLPDLNEAQGDENILDRKTVLNDPLTGLYWLDAEKAMGLSGNNNKEETSVPKQRQQVTPMSEEDISEEIGSQLMNNERLAQVGQKEVNGNWKENSVEIDLLTGRSWLEVEESMGLTGK